MVYQQIVGIPMGTNCAPLIADLLFLYCYERDLMSDLYKSKSHDLIDVFNDTSRYLDDIFTINNPEFAGSGKVGPVNQVNHTSWVAVVTPTDCPKSVRNRCVIELFCGVVYIFNLPFWHFCCCRGFCHRTESDLFLFLIQSYVNINKKSR